MALLPESVVEYVLNHQHDVAREERWRTAMQKELSTIEMQLRKGHSEAVTSNTAQVHRLERAFAAMSGSSSDVHSARVRDLEATVETLTRQLDRMQVERNAEMERSDGRSSVRTPTASPPPDFSFSDEFAEEDALYAGTIERAGLNRVSFSESSSSTQEPSVVRERSEPAQTVAGVAPPPLFTSRSSEF